MELKYSINNLLIVEAYAGPIRYNVPVFLIFLIYFPSIARDLQKSFSRLENLQRWDRPSYCSFRARGLGVETGLTFMLAAVQSNTGVWDILAVYGSYRKWRVLEQGCRRRLEPYRPLQQRGRAL